MRAPLGFTVPGNPVPKARPQHGANGNTFTPRATRQAEAVVRWHYRAAAARSQPRTGPLALSIAFHCATRRRVDLDNLAKTVLDALNGHGYADDSQIMRLCLSKQLGVGPARARTEITIEAAEDGTALVSP